MAPTMPTIVTMGWFRKSENKAPAALSPSAGGAENRRALRFPTAVISCMLGPVVDLSIGGMRIHSAKVPPLAVGDLLRLELQSPKDELLVVGQVKRIRKRRPMGYEIGIEFQQLTPDIRAAIESLGRHGCIKGRKPPGRDDATTPSGGSANPNQFVAKAHVPDLYALIGVTPDATAEQIHRAFREGARKVHPDLNPSPEAQSRFIELHKAYDVLKSPEARTAYDSAVAKRTAA